MININEMDLISATNENDGTTTIQFIQGQRGHQLLVFDNYTYAKNNVKGNTTYWNCRSRRKGHNPCKARLSTVKDDDCLRVSLSKPHHNHPPYLQKNRKRQTF